MQFQQKLCPNTNDNGTRYDAHTVVTLPTNIPGGPGNAQCRGAWLGQVCLGCCKSNNAGGTVGAEWPHPWPARLFLQLWQKEDAPVNDMLQHPLAKLMSVAFRHPKCGRNAVLHMQVHILVQSQHAYAACQS
eukprot:434752-Amphidinium_carterae.2